MRESAVATADVCCSKAPACSPMLVAATNATYSATSPMRRRITPVKYPPTAYPITSTMGIRSIHVMSRPSSERRAVLFFECDSDLSPYLVHFGVRQGALGAPESQGKCDALVPVGNLRAAVFVERPRALENLAAGLIDSGQ